MFNAGNRHISELIELHFTLAGHAHNKLRVLTFAPQFPEILFLLSDEGSLLLLQMVVGHRVIWILSLEFLSRICVS